MQKNQRFIKNLVGKTFNRVTIISPSKVFKENQWYHCQCQCGNNFETNGASIKNGNTKSCGCLKAEGIRERAKTNFGRYNKNYLGYQEIPGTYFCEIKKGAIKRQLEFNITLEQIWNLFLQQNRKCIFSGMELKFNTRLRSRDGTASLDRIDSSKGYTIDNVQWVHKILNLMKNKMSDKEFLDWINIIYCYQQIK